MSQMTEQETVLFNKVYVPALRKAAAARGVHLNTQEDLTDFLEVAAMVDAHAAAANSSTIKQASQTLKRTLGVDKAEATVAAETTIKQATVELSQDPQILDAILGSAAK